MAPTDEAPFTDAREFEVRTDRASENAVTLRVIGELDLSTHQQVRDPLVGAAETKDSVVVDLSECEFVDSSGIRALLVGREALASNGEARLVVAAPQPQVQRILEMTGVGEAIPVYASVEQALEGLA